MRTECCSSHLFNTIPAIDGDLLDFKNRGAPQEDGLYHAHQSVVDTWSAYCYNNHIYAGNVARGFDVYSYKTTAQHEYLQFPHLNPQTQEHVLYPLPLRPARSAPEQKH